MRTSNQTFATRIVAWQKHSGRHDLPWQRTDDPYRIWLSEIMLQQTQVTAVIPYFYRFLERFPTVLALANADEDAVLAAWSGLGYYARARNLHRAARLVVERHEGKFPQLFEDIVALPGVGRSTAGAISVFAFGGRFPILDGNVKRVIARFFGIDGYPGSKASSDQLWRQAEVVLPHDDLAAYTQGLMDLGAQVCRRSQPKCVACPLTNDCVARREGRVGELPTPRPRKQRSRRSTVMLIVTNADQILLEKRPSTGVWGGLWSFPEVDSSEQAAQTCRQTFGVELGNVDKLPVLEHGFTHFSLSIQPLLCDVIGTEPRAQMPGREWVRLNDAHAYALPVPVRKLVSDLEISIGRAERELQPD